MKNRKVITAWLILFVSPMIANAGDQKSQLEILIGALVVCPPGAPTRFVDNGDGTICDHETGLMWEKKNASDGVTDLSNPHDVDNTYKWSNAGSNPDGPAFTDFLARLNGEKASTVPSEQLGGYSDWRMPTSTELQTLLFEPFTCSIDPCIIDPVFAPTGSWPYWSFTSSATNTLNAWYVYFGDGTVDVYPKSSEDLVFNARAVRGSLRGR